MSTDEALEFLKMHKAEDAAKIIAEAQLEAAKVLAASKVQSSFWKWVSLTLVGMMVSSVGTYAVIAKDYVVQRDFTKLESIVIENTKNLNRLIGVVDQIVKEK